jgi:hypothetical protein
LALRPQRFEIDRLMRSASAMQNKMSEDAARADKFEKEQNLTILELQKQLKATEEALLANETALTETQGALARLTQSNVPETDKQIVKSVPLTDEQKIEASRRSILALENSLSDVEGSIDANEVQYVKDAGALRDAQIELARNKKAVSTLENQDNKEFVASSDTTSILLVPKAVEISERRSRTSSSDIRRSKNDSTALPNDYEKLIAIQSPMTAQLKQRTTYLADLEREIVALERQIVEVQNEITEAHVAVANLRDSHGNHIK